MGLPPASRLDADTRLDLKLAALCALGPAVWSLSLGVLYALSEHECGHRRAGVSLVLTVLAALICVTAIVSLVRLRARLPRESATKRAPARRALMVHAGLGLNTLSLLLVLGFLLPLLSLVPCE